jgi:hypothetical protein
MVRSGVLFDVRPELINIIKATLVFKGFYSAIV